MLFEDTEYEEALAFDGCLCPHEPPEHGWFGCLEDGCPCIGHWLE